MEINLKQLGTQAVEASTGTKKMRLSENATSMVFQLFTKNIYSNPIGTVVREITSNCFDSHVEAGINAPVLIKKMVDNQTNTTYISFIDYGVGMSPDRVENIYGVYFESTKRTDNTQIGGFGIGGKTPLAYKRSTGRGEGEYDNSFYLITNFDGMKYFYCIFEGTESPVISLLHSEPTKEHNGSEVRIPVLEKDVFTFAKEMVRQLYYFENIIFDGFEDSSFTETLSNEYQILRGKTFLYRGSEYDNHIHVCLGRVAYPIDYNVLGLNSSDYLLPIALKLEVGEIGVTASRETLDYSEGTIKTLKKKLEETKDEIKKLLNKQYENIVTLKDYFSVKNEFGVLKFPNGMSIKAVNLVSIKDVDFSNFRYSFMKMPNDKQLFNFFFDAKMYGNKRYSRRYSRDYNFTGGYDELIAKKNLLYVENDFVRKVVKQGYLKELHDTYHIITRRNLTSSLMRQEISELFNVHMTNMVDDNGKPVAYLQTLIDMQEEYFSIVRENAEDYDLIEIPAEFLVRRKRNVLSEDVRNTTIPIRFFGNYGKHRVKLDSLFKFKEPIFYGTTDDENKLQNAYSIYNMLFDKETVVSRYAQHDNTFSRTGKKGIMFIMVAKSYEKYMKFCSNVYHIDGFYHRMLYRKENSVQEYFKTYSIIDKYDELKNLFRTNVLEKINPKYGDILKKVKKHIHTLPNRSSSLCSYEEELKKYFDLSNLELSPEQVMCDKMIDELLDLQTRNEKILKYIDLPYYMDGIDDDLIEILKKVMVF